MNLLITNALKHVPDVILFLSNIKNQSVFNFCAIPQVINNCMIKEHGTRTVPVVTLLSHAQRVGGIL